MDSTRRPILELLVGPRLSPGVTDVVVRTARSCTPRAAGPGVLGAARLATSLDAPRLQDAIDDPTVPLAVVVDRAPVDGAVTARADVVLAPADLAVTAPAEVLRLPRVDPWRHRPVAPFVRAGWRRRLGFPADFVVVFGFAPPTRVGPRSIATVLALASTAAVRGEHAALAMALGTPVVTDAATAAELGAIAGRDVLVVGDGDGTSTDVDAAALEAARELATQPVECARLGRQAREFVETHHDPELVARRLTERLGFAAGAPDEGVGSASILRSACAELGLPPDGTVLAHRLLVAGRMERAPR